MSTPPSYDQIRKIIKSENDEKFRIAFMYQYLIGGRVSEVAGKYRPLGIDAKQVEVWLNDSCIEAILFKIQSQNQLVDFRYALFPLNEKYDPWVKMVYDYFQKDENTAPFAFHEDVETSKKYMMTRASMLFENQIWRYPAYTKTGNRIKERTQNFTSDDLREIREMELEEKYNFNEGDMALFGICYNQIAGYRGIQIQEIKEEDLSSYSEQQIIERAIPYFIKLVSSEEKMLPIGKPWSEAECYFAVWGYDLIDSDDDVVISHIAKDIANLINRSPKSVEYKFQNIAHFDPRPYEEKPFSPKHNAQKLLGEVFKWYWKDRATARTRFDEFKNKLTVIEISDTKKGDVTDGLNKRIMVEEGSISSSTINMRKRSSRLVQEARNYFRDLDKDGKLRCRSCGYVKPDSIVNEIVHIHHIEPLMELDDEGMEIDVKEYINKLTPLCPNCHSIAHSKRPPLNIDEIKAIRKNNE